MSLTWDKFGLVPNSQNSGKLALCGLPGDRALVGLQGSASTQLWIATAEGDAVTFSEPTLIADAPTGLLHPYVVDMLHLGDDRALVSLGVLTQSGQFGSQPSYRWSIRHYDTSGATPVLLGSTPWTTAAPTFLLPRSMTRVPDTDRVVFVRCEDTTVELNLMDVSGDTPVLLDKVLDFGTFYSGGNTLMTKLDLTVLPDGRGFVGPNGPTSSDSTHYTFQVTGDEIAMTGSFVGITDEGAGGQRNRWIGYSSEPSDAGDTLFQVFAPYNADGDFAPATYWIGRGTYPDGAGRPTLRDLVDHKTFLPSTSRVVYGLEAEGAGYSGAGAPVFVVAENVNIPSSYSNYFPVVIFDPWGESGDPVVSRAFDSKANFPLLEDDYEDASYDASDYYYGANFGENIAFTEGGIWVPLQARNNDNWIYLVHVSTPTPIPSALKGTGRRFV